MSAPEPRLVSVAALTHVGKVRPHNEDCVAVGDWLNAQPMEAPRRIEQSLDRPFACMVVDGMGGAAAGEVASRLVAEYLSSKIPGCATEGAVSTCIRDANTLLFDRMSSREGTMGMGATVAGLRIGTEGIVAFNVGDSRVYRVQDGYLSQLSVDDVPPKQHGAAGRSGAVTQCLGGMARYCDVLPHVHRQVLAPRTYLLCSDGLYDGLELEELEAAIDDDLGASVSRLFQRAMDAGARDNISIILLRLLP